MGQQFFAVFLVLGLLLATLWLLRRQGLARFIPERFVPGLGRPAAKQRQMQVLERVALDTRHSLHLVALNGRLIVVGVSPGGCRRIAALPAEAATLAPPVDTALGQSAKTTSL